ncbi:hypothetical protein OV203_09120 [Nannocystis sp. ILAH1]|jgi:ElaB/YqjD/DUF883 family membrane-anchored ribosome-binding protein|uniref:hypothetical protein n=1 Tax=unclassified Nannocystis TaxID=2627009 RepID=UPI00226DB89C|nr:MULTISPECIES: hypothetical protein [unclassified Nannocystis]MCY0987282.1 hypothetical protein [Nannocystis sp. ILAH1]MCY1070922.1 hypothetical protein [Nannocystis sp. RBIL2]
MTSLKDTLENSMQELRTLRDEIRVRLNLAGKEARDRWEQLEPKLEQLEQQVRSATDATLESIRDAIERARTSFHEYRAQLTQGSAGGVTGSGSGDEPDFSSVEPQKR